MAMKKESTSDPSNAEDEAGPRHRLRTLLVGSVVALVVGLAIAFCFTYFMYGGTSLDSILGAKKGQAAAGKLAYEKKTGVFVGVIKSQGFSARKRAEVYYVERPGGGLIEVDLTAVEVRDRPKVESTPSPAQSPGA